MIYRRLGTGGLRRALAGRRPRAHPRGAGRARRATVRRVDGRRLLPPARGPLPVRRLRPQLECRLLPLLEAKPAHRAKTTGCLDAANHARRKADRDPLKRGDSKLPASYREASVSYRKRKTLLDRAGDNPSLKVFVDALGRRFDTES